MDVLDPSVMVAAFGFVSLSLNGAVALLLCLWVYDGGCLLTGACGVRRGVSDLNRWEV